MLSTQWMKTVGIRVPIIQAGIAGKTTNPQFISAVSNAGGLGTLGAGLMEPELIRSHIQAIRSLTPNPFAVNLFIHPPESLKQMIPSDIKRVEFEEQVAVLIEEKVPVFSFTFGIPSASIIEKFKQIGTYMIGTATTLQDAIALEKAGIDTVVAQGKDAGGYHSSMAQCSTNEERIGTMTLIPQMTDVIQLPVIAAGGITDGRGIAATLALGAVGVQMGTAFLSYVQRDSQDLSKCIQILIQTWINQRNKIIDQLANIKNDPFPL